MTKVSTNLYDVTELEYIDLRTVSENGQRFYCDDEGRKYPSVTTVVGLDSREHIKAWRKRVGEEEANKISTMASNRGTKFHSLVEDYLRKEKPLIEFDNILQEGMFKAIRPLLDEIVPLSLEAPLYSDTLRMAGRVDCIGVFEDAMAIIDFKTASKYKEEKFARPWFLQMTAYAIMVEELTGVAIDEICAIVSIEGANAFQLFVDEPQNYVEELFNLRQRYENLYGI
jgi:genome maintenance exonuclease 1